MSQSASAEASQLSDEDELSDIDLPTSNPVDGRKPPKLGKALQKRTSTTAAKASAGAGGNPQDQQLAAQPQQYSAPAPQQDTLPPTVSRGSRRMIPVHESRIADRAAKVGEKDSNLKIKIELDLEVELELYARVKGDITIGLM